MKQNNSKNISVRSNFGPMPLSKELQSLTKDLLGKRGFANADLLLHWNDVIGEELSKAVKPDKMTYTKSGRTGAVLHVRVGAGAFAVLVEHQKKILIDRINTFLGYDAISDIKIRQDLIEIKPPIPVEKEKKLTVEQEMLLTEKLKNIEDEDVRKKLYNIGKSIFFK